MRSFGVTFFIFAGMVLNFSLKAELSGTIKFNDGLPHLKEAVENRCVYITMWGTGAYAKSPVRKLEGFSGEWHPTDAEHRDYSLGALDASASCDLIGYANGPGFLLIDTFCNDTEYPAEQVRTGLKYIRNRIPAHRDAVFIYSPTKKFPDDIHSPSYQEIHKVYEDFAQQNGIPTIDLAAYLHAKLKSGELSETDCKNPLIFRSVCRESAERLLTELMRESLFVQLSETAKKEIRSKRQALIKMQKMDRVSYETDTYPAGWLPWQLTPVKDCPHILTGTGKNEFVFSFKGSALGMVIQSTPQSGNFLYSVDHSPWQEIAVEPVKAGVQSHAILLTTEMTRSRIHQLRLKLADPAKKLSVAYFLIAEFENPIATASLKGIDAVYAKIPPLHFKPRQKILEDLPQTHHKLTTGKPLSILLLGDSIMNGIRHSFFDLLLREMYPKSKITILTSLRGSTGCWYYQMPEAFQNYVGRKQFDLLIIGGISHQNDIEAIRKVVDMTRKTHPDAEILLMTDAWGVLQNMDPRSPQYDRPPAMQDNTYQGKLLKLRSEYASGVAFMDITTPWAHYLRESGVPYTVFKGDPVHANYLGNQLLGRIIEAYFAPDNYDPYTQWKKRNQNRKTE